jgi:hypothetical protein
MLKPRYIDFHLVSLTFISHEDVTIVEKYKRKSLFCMPFQNVIIWIHYYNLKVVLQAKEMKRITIWIFLR